MSNREIDHALFHKLIQGEGGMVLVYSPACGPCKSFKPVITDVADKKNVPLHFLDITREGTLLDIESVPTTIFYKEGKVISKEVGAMSEEMFAEKLKEFLRN